MSLSQPEKLCFLFPFLYVTILFCIKPSLTHKHTHAYTHKLLHAVKTYSQSGRIRLVLLRSRSETVRYYVWCLRVASTKTYRKCESCLFRVRLYDACIVEK